MRFLISSSFLVCFSSCFDDYDDDDTFSIAYVFLSIFSFVCFLINDLYILHGCATQRCSIAISGNQHWLNTFFIFGLQAPIEQNQIKSVWQKIARAKKLEILRSNLMSLADTKKKKKYTHIHWFLPKKLGVTSSPSSIRK